MQYTIVFKHKYFPLLLLKTLLIIVLVSYLGFFSYINNFIYNIILPTLPYSNSHYKEFVLVDAYDMKKSDLMKTVYKLSSYKPKSIISDTCHQIVTINESNLSTFIEENPKLLFSMPTAKIADRSEELMNYQDYIYVYDFHKLYDSSGYKFNINSENNELATLFMNKSSMLYSSDKKYINFNGNPPFVKVHAKDILYDNLIADFFENKIVIVSNFDNSYILSKDSSLSREEFVHQMHLAYMLNSSMQNDWLQEFTLWEYYLFILIATIVWIYILYKLSFLYITYAFFISLIIPISLYWSFVAYANFLLPVSEMIFLALWTAINLVGHWQNLKNSDEKNLLTSMKKRVSEKTVHETFYNSDKYWSELIMLINQLFNINKNILFEKVDNDTRIREVISLNCDFNDINEMRRDYTREPYTTAIKMNSVIEPERKFFHNLDKNEKEFIVSLVHQNKIVGFWAFSLTEDELEEMKNFEYLIMNCAREISKLLSDRSSFLAKKLQQSHQYDTLLNIEVDEENLKKFKKNIAIFEKRMLLTELVFDTIHSQVIIYDLFGKIIQINEQMSYLLQEKGIAPYTMTAGDLLASLTDIDLTEAKEIIRNIVFLQKKHTQFVSIKDSERTYLLMVSAITQEKISDKFTVSYFFETYGIVFELIDFHFVDDIYHLKQDIMELSLANDTQRLLNLQKSFEFIMRQDEQSNYPYKSLEKKLSHIVDTRESLSSLMQQKIDFVEEDLYPINIMKNMQLACDTIKKEYTNKQINFTIESETSSPFGLVAIYKIKHHLEDLLIFLLDDIEDKGSIDIIFQRDEQYLSLTLHSDGFGIPQKQLDIHLSAQSKSEKYLILKKIEKSILSWNGKINFVSELGEGVTITIYLQAVDL